MLATIVVALLLFVQPERGRRRFERLKIEVRTDPTARLRFYRRGIIAAWILTAIVAAIGALAHGAGHPVGLPPAPSTAAQGFVWLLTLELALFIPISALVMRSRNPRIQRLVRRQIGHLRAMLPVSRAERIRFVAVAFTAGICEEVVYRWFAIGYIRWLAPGSSDLLVIVLVAVGFGLAHFYQGRLGVLATGLIGGLFAWLTLQSGSIVPAMIAHVLIDLRVAVLREIPDPELADEMLSELRAAAAPLPPPS